jgi:uncharacterized protein (TIGR03437 family)
LFFAFALSVFGQPPVPASTTQTAFTTGPEDSTFTTGFVWNATASRRPYITKLDSNGKQAYSIVLNEISGIPTSIAVNARGEALIGGNLSTDPRDPVFPTTPGTVQPNSMRSPGFLIKLDASGQRIQLAVRGFGRGMVAFDSTDNIYIAGILNSAAEITPSVGAFQSTLDPKPCDESVFVLPGTCTYQYVAKLNPTATSLIYATFLTGSFGASPAGILIDAAGNATIAGTTISRNYPVSPDAFQPTYKASVGTDLGFINSLLPPAPSGYISQLNASGTGLNWSTYFSGTGSELIRGISRTQTNSFLISGQSSSTDLPGAQFIPSPCVDPFTADIPFLAEVSSDGSRIIRARYLYDFDFSKPPSSLQSTAATPYFCVVDPADNTRLSKIVPGQLLTIFQEDFGPGEYAVQFNGLSVTMLYRSKTQANLRAPDLSQNPNAFTIEAGLGATRLIPIATSAPAAFLDLSKPFSSQSAICNLTLIRGASALATNEDGTLNSCTNPAPRGSIVTFYLNGLPLEGARATLDQNGEVVSLTQGSGPTAGLWQLKIRLSQDFTSGSLSPTISGTRLRNPNLAVWVAR